MTPRFRRLVAPDLPAAVSLVGEELEIRDLGSGVRLEASGALAEQAWRFLEEEELGPALQALDPGSPLRRSLQRLAESPRLPLTPASALRLGGFDILFLELTGRCTARCAHCYAGAGPAVEAALDQRTCQELLAELPELGVGVVQLTGGEPLLCPFLPELVAQVAEQGGPVCEIYTNGTLLDQALLDRLVSYRPRFAMSFYSARPEVHDAITGLPGSHARTSEAIGLVLERGLELRVNVIVMPENAGHLDATLAYLRGLGVERVSYGASFAVGRGRLYLGPMDPGPQPPQAEEAAGQGGRLCVSSDGGVYPCIFNRTDLLGHLSERSLTEIALRPRPPASADRDPDAFLERSAVELPCLLCRFSGYVRRLGALEEPP